LTVEEIAASEALLDQLLAQASDGDRTDVRHGAPSGLRTKLP
jgi:hypothetical protein